MTEQPPTLPPLYTRSSTILLIIFYFYWQAGLLWLALITAILPFTVAPFGDLKMVIRFYQNTFKKYPGYPWTLNWAAFWSMTNRILWVWPLLTILWLIDEYIYTGWKTQKVERPVFVLGQPRSGTTKLEEILEEDKQFVCLKFFEVMFPVACVQMLLLKMWKLDQEHLGGRITDWVKQQIEKRDRETAPERSQMRRVGLHYAEEDDFFFFVAFYEGIFPEYFHPSAEAVKTLKYFAKHDPAKRLVMLQEHKKAIQKTLWVHQSYENSISTEPIQLRYVAKWVVGWAAETEAMVNFYADSQCLFIVRPPEQSVPSWFKLYGLLSTEYVGYDLMETSPEFLAVTKQLTIEGFQNEINLWKSLPADRKHLFDFAEFYSNMPKTLKGAYDHFNWRYSQKFDGRLHHLQEAQKAFRSASKVDESQITTKEIKEEFPDVYNVLLGRK